MNKNMEKQKGSLPERIQLALSFFMQATLLIALVSAAINQRWTVMFTALLAMLVIQLPSMLEKNHRLHIPIEFEFILTLFIYASLFLGEVHGYYTRFWWWDALLHTGSGIALGFVGFLILYSLYRNSRLDMSPVLLSVFAFSFAMAIGGVWEIFEFGMDSLFGMNMQKTGLVDTMWDLIVDALGAFIASVSGYFYMTRNKRGVGLFHYYISSYFEEKSDT